MFYRFNRSFQRSIGPLPNKSLFWCLLKPNIYVSPHSARLQCKYPAQSTSFFRRRRIHRVFLEHHAVKLVLDVVESSRCVQGDLSWNVDSIVEVEALEFFFEFIKESMFMRILDLDQSFIEIKILFSTLELDEFVQDVLGHFVWLRASRTNTHDNGRRLHF